MNQIKYFLISLRPYQLIKNLLVFAALIFSGNLFSLEALQKSMWMFIFFSMASSGGYIINDWRDRKEDLFHPGKRNRPIASGKLNPNLAITGAVFLLVLSVIGTSQINIESLYIIISYISLTIFYSFFLKHIPILDLLIVAIGFVLRAVEGAMAITVVISPWLLVCTFFLALFLIIGKRRHELIILANEAHRHRFSLNYYDPVILDLMLAIMGASTMVTYTMYLLNSITQKPNFPIGMLLTIPFVILGLFRYFYLVFRKELGGRPEHILLNDSAILTSTAGWFIVTVVSLCRF